MAALGNLLSLALDPHSVDVERSYPNLGIYSFGRGTFHKRPIEGNSTSATTLYRIRSGQFIYSRLFAFEGAYSIILDEFDGHFVSNEFPTFNIDRDQLDASYLRWLFTRSSTWESLASRATGMGDRRQRIHPEHVLSFAIPLPPLPEQRRIATRLDAVAGRVAARSRALAAVEAELNATVLIAFERRPAFGRRAPSPHGRGRPSRPTSCGDR